MFSSNCDSKYCRVPTKYDSSNSSSFSHGTIPSSSTSIRSAYSKIFTPLDTFAVTYERELFKIQMGPYERETNFTDFNFGILNKYSTTTT